MKNKVFGIIFTIMSMIILGLMYFSITAMDMYHKEKRNNKKAAKEFIKLAVRYVITEVNGFQDLQDQLHEINDITKKMKQC